MLLRIYLRTEFKWQLQVCTKDSGRRVLAVAMSMWWVLVGMGHVMHLQTSGQGSPGVPLPEFTPWGKEVWKVSGGISHSVVSEGKRRRGHGVCFSAWVDVIPIEKGAGGWRGWDCLSTGFGNYCSSHWNAILGPMWGRGVPAIFFFFFLGDPMSAKQ